MSVRCTRGHVWPDSLELDWGKPESAKASDGLGPDPVCPAIIEDPRTGAGSVCRARLQGSKAAVTHDPATGKESAK